MDTPEAIRILKQLADGRDPATGDSLSDASVYHQPDVIRALFHAVEALDTTKRSRPRRERRVRRQPREVGLPANAGSPWTPEEDSQLTAEYTQGTPIHQMAHTHQRTAGAIASRLERLGHIDPAQKKTYVLHDTEKT
jgi:hypothetical protein